MEVGEWRRGQDISSSLLWVSFVSCQAGAPPAWCKGPVLSRITFLPPVLLAFTITRSSSLLPVPRCLSPLDCTLSLYSHYKSHLHLKHLGFILTPLGHFLIGLAYLILLSALPLTILALCLQLQVYKSDSITGPLLPGHPTDVSNICKPEGTSFHKFCYSSYIPYDGKLSYPS